MKLKSILWAITASFLMAACGGGGGSIVPTKSVQASTPSYNPDDLYQFFAVAFGAAPGTVYMGQLLDAANAGMSIKDIVNVFTTKDQFTSVYPLTLTDAEFATRLSANVIGLSATDQAKQNAVTDIVNALASPGWTRGDVIYAVFNNLANKSPTDPEWGGTSTKMKNQVVYAKYYTEVMKGDSTIVATLQSVIKGVTENANTTAGIEKTIYTAMAATATTFSVPTDISKIAYPDSYQTVTIKTIDINTDPCNLDLGAVAYPKSWTGKYPLPTIKGAPFPVNFYGGISLKDIMLPNNPTFNPNCVGNLNNEFDRTISRLVDLNVKFVKIPQWHWMQVNQDGSWSVVKAENSFGPLPDANLSYFVTAAHKAGLKVIMMNQIQGINNPDTGYSYVPESNMENYAKWFGALKEYLLDRGPYFQSLGVDVWELGCGSCLFNNIGTSNTVDMAYFATQTKSLIPIMRNSFTGSLLVVNNPWTDDPGVVDAIDYVNFGIYDVGWGKITSANADTYSVSTAVAAFMSDQLNSDAMHNNDKLGKTLVFDITIQSRANAFAMPGYLEETGCTSSIGNLNISTTSCLQKETTPDFSVQAIFFEAVFESLRSLNLTSKIIPLPMDYWETNSMISTDVFPSLGSTIRNKPAEGIVKAWFAK